MSPDIEIRHDVAGRRFSAQVDGADCELDYVVESGVLTILHTGVPPEVGGRGIAAALTGAVATYARAERLKVNPACSYASVYFRRHPEFSDLLA